MGVSFGNLNSFLFDSSKKTKDILKWNKGQTKWDGGSMIFQLCDAKQSVYTIVGLAHNF